MVRGVDVDTLDGVDFHSQVAVDISLGPPQKIFWMVKMLGCNGNLRVKHCFPFL